MASSSRALEEDWELTPEDLIALGLLSSDQQQQYEQTDEFPPNIHELFRHYNKTYFHSSLDFCSVEWSTGRMTLCAGICMFSKASGCRIKLSEPLLKYRPLKDLKETLLHEMIHAYQFLVDRGPPDRDDHGPRFKQLMQSINTSTVPDPQRPPGGYKIDTHHTMIDEVNLYRVHWWECQRCNNIIKRAMNRRPQPADCRGRMGRGDACQDPLCLYHMHIKTCGGEYVKTRGPDLDKAKTEKESGAGPSKAANSKRSKVMQNDSSARKKKAPAGSVSEAGASAAGPSSTPPITQFFKKTDTVASVSRAPQPTSAKDLDLAELPPENRPEEQRARCLEAALMRLGHTSAAPAQPPIASNGHDRKVKAAEQPAAVVLELADSQPVAQANVNRGETAHLTTSSHASKTPRSGTEAIAEVIQLDASDDELTGRQFEQGSEEGQAASHGRGLTLQCPVCGQTWKRGRISNQQLNEHLDKCLQR